MRLSKRAIAGVVLTSPNKRATDGVVLIIPSKHETAGAGLIMPSKHVIGGAEARKPSWRRAVGGPSAAKQKVSPPLPSKRTKT